MMRARLEALIFDVDGTIADTEEMHRRAFNAAFASFGLEWHWDARLYGELLQITGGKERLAAYIERLPVTPAEQARLLGLVTALHAAKTALYRELIERTHVCARPGIAPLMRQARAAGVRLAIASTTSPQNIAPLLAAVLDDANASWFDVVASGDVVACKKPAADIYQFTLAALGLPPQRAMALEDSALGVRSAKAAGLFTVAWPNRWTAAQDFQAADLVLAPSAAVWELERLAAAHAAAAAGAMHVETA